MNKKMFLGFLAFFSLVLQAASFASQFSEVTSVDSLSNADDERGSGR